MHIPAFSPTSPHLFPSHFILNQRSKDRRDPLAALIRLLDAPIRSAISQVQHDIDPPSSRPMAFSRPFADAAPTVHPQATCLHRPALKTLDLVFGCAVLDDAI
jgi:hypothetical protein